VCTVLYCTVWAKTDCFYEFVLSLFVWWFWVWKDCIESLYLCIQNIEFPETMSAEMRTLVEGLLKREVEDRLGCLGNGLVGSLSYVLSNIECECVELNQPYCYLSSARRRRPCQTTAFCRHSNTRCQSDVQQFWRQDLCHRRTTSLEQSVAQSQTVCCHTASSGGYWRHFHSDSEATV